MTVSISVALCTHNGARFIEEQVRSILAQTTPVAEIVVSDDASTDGTVALIRASLEGSEVSLRVIENPVPLGVTANFEQAVTATTGEMIALCDQDDVWAPQKLEVLAAQLADNPELLLVFSDATLVDEAGSPLPASLFDSLEATAAHLEAIRDGRAFETLLRRNLVTGATVVFRRSLLEVALPFERSWLHDEWLAILAAASNGLGWDARPLIDYRQHSANQVGVSKPTLRYKISRVLEPRGTRTSGLVRRTRALGERLRGLGLPGDDLVEAKLRLESARAALPASRLRRIGPILRAARGSSYARFASQGRADMLRDLLQRA